MATPKPHLGAGGAKWASPEEAASFWGQEQLVLVGYTEQPEEHELLAQWLAVVEVGASLRSTQAFAQCLLVVLDGGVPSHLMCIPNPKPCPTWPEG